LLTNGRRQLCYWRRSSWLGGLLDGRWRGDCRRRRFLPAYRNRLGELRAGNHRLILRIQIVEDCQCRKEDDDQHPRDAHAA